MSQAHTEDEIYKELCDIIDRSPTRTPEQVLSFFVSENIINSWEALDYETKYKQEHKVLEKVCKKCNGFGWISDTTLKGFKYCDNCNKTGKVKQ